MSVNGSLSIVMPIYNESAVIEQFLEELDVEVAQKFESAEIVIVDDRSTDETPALLDRLAERMPRLRVVHADVNRGHGPTMRRAIDLANGDWIFQVDSDRQFLASEFWSLWEKRTDADLVLGVRAARKDPRHRLALTAVVRLATSLLAGKPLRDPNVPFKLFTAELWRKLAPQIPEDALAPSIMLAIATCVGGHEVVEVPVTHLPRRHGISTLRLWRLVKFSLRGLAEIVRFRLSLR